MLSAGARRGRQVFTVCGSSLIPYWTQRIAGLATRRIGSVQNDRHSGSSAIAALTKGVDIAHDRGEQKANWCGKLQSQRVKLPGARPFRSLRAL